MMTEAVQQRPFETLFSIETELLELMEFRECAETEEERAAADKQIAAYVEKEVRKVDGIRAYLRHADVMATAAKDEATLQRARAMLWESRAAKLKESVLAIMELIGVKKLEGRTGILQSRGNGGVQPLTITDELLIPIDCKTTTITLSTLEANAIAYTLERYAPPGLWAAFVNCSKTSPANDLIRKALAERCPRCGGAKIDCPTGPTSFEPCGDCDGTGTRKVPGARLEARGVSLTVK